MNSILVGKDAQKVAVLDWAEEMRVRGWWVDINTRLNCEHVIAKCGSLSTAREVEARGGTMVTALIELMKKWDAIYSEAAELDREWKAFVSGLPDGVVQVLWQYENDGRYHAVVSGEDGAVLTVAGKDEAVTKRGLMAAWAAINNE